MQEFAPVFAVCPAVGVRQTMHFLLLVRVVMVLLQNYSRQQRKDQPMLSRQKKDVPPDVLAE